MAAEIETMAFMGATPWHGLGTALEEADVYHWPTACKKADLDWDVELVRLVTADTLVHVDRRAVRRKSDGHILGTVGPYYSVLQNSDCFKWFQPFLDAREAALHTAGSLHKGRRVWVLAKLNRDPLVIAAGDEVEKFILLSHGLDGTMAVRVGWTPIRVVCQNTLSMAHSSKASKLIRVRHSRSVHKNLENIRNVMNLANQEFEATAEQYRLLARKSINFDDLNRYLKKVLAIKDDKEPSEQAQQHLYEIMALCEAGRGNRLPSIRGTLWAAYNGVTEWLAYRRGRGSDTRLNSLWFGDNVTTNRVALETALTMAA